MDYVRVVVGISSGLLAAFFASLGDNLIRASHFKELLRPVNVRRPKHKRPLFVFGNFCIIILNPGLSVFTASLINQSLSAPLGATHNIFNVILAYFLLGEKISWRSILGTLCIFGGATAIIFGSDATGKNLPFDEAVVNMTTIWGILYIGSLGGGSILLFFISHMIKIDPKKSRRMFAAFAFVPGFLGGLLNTSVKFGFSAIYYCPIWVSLVAPVTVGIGVCVFLTLNRCLKYLPTTRLIPVYSSTVMISASLGGMALMGEHIDILYLYLIGFAFIIVGVVVLSAMETADNVMNQEMLLTTEQQHAITCQDLLLEDQHYVEPLTRIDAESLKNLSLSDKRISEAKNQNDTLICGLLNGNSQRGDVLIPENLRRRHEGFSSSFDPDPTHLQRLDLMTHRLAGAFLFLRGRHQKESILHDRRNCHSDVQIVSIEQGDTADQGFEGCANEETQRQIMQQVIEESMPANSQNPKIGRSSLESRGRDGVSPSKAVHLSRLASRVSVQALHASQNHLDGELLSPVTVNRACKPVNEDMNSAFSPNALLRLHAQPAFSDNAASTSPVSTNDPLSLSPTVTSAVSLGHLLVKPDLNFTGGDRRVVNRDNNTIQPGITPNVYSPRRSVSMIELKSIHVADLNRLASASSMNPTSDPLSTLVANHPQPNTRVDSSTYMRPRSSSVSHQLTSVPAGDGTSLTCEFAVDDPMKFLNDLPCDDGVPINENGSVPSMKNNSYFDSRLSINLPNHATSPVSHASPRVSLSLSPTSTGIGHQIFVQTGQMPMFPMNEVSHSHSRTAELFLKTTSNKSDSDDGGNLELSQP